MAGNTLYKDIPQVFTRLFNKINTVLDVLNNTSAVELSKYWGETTTEKKKVADWINKVAANSKTLQGASHLDIGKILTTMVIQN